MSNTTELRYKEKLALLDTFMIMSVVTIVGIRLFLELTNYPQIGGNGLHIAHMLWGGLGLTASVLLLLLVEKPPKELIAIVAGVSFGFFIDEIGKFVTSDNNYFFKPSAFLIYVIILVIWFTARVFIARRSGGVFLSAAEWPKQVYLRRAVVLWVVGNVLTGLAAVYGALFDGVNILGFTNEFSEFMPTVIAVVSVIYILGLVEYRLKRTHLAARTIRTGALVSAVTIYPYTFYEEQFSAIIGCVVTVLVVIALSESSLKEIVRPIAKAFGH